MLGKEPAGSEVIATSANFSGLLSVFNAFRDNAEASNEALRCIANALLLISDGRQIFVQKDVGGGDVMAELLEVRALFCHDLSSYRLAFYRSRPRPNEYSSYPGYYSLRQFPWPVVTLSGV